MCLVRVICCVQFYLIKNWSVMCDVCHVCVRLKFAVCVWTKCMISIFSKKLSSSAFLLFFKAKIEVKFMTIYADL